jgi:hypothetical protein
MALSTISGGIDTGFSTKLNNNFRGDRILQVYTGTGINVSLNNTATSTHTSSTELTAVASSSLGGADYLIFDITGLAQAGANVGTSGSGNGYISLKIETKPIGGSYTTTMVESNIFQFGISAGADGGENNYSLGRILTQWVHTLTASEKSSGVQAKITMKAYVTSDNAGTAIFTLSQLVERTGI